MTRFLRNVACSYQLSATRVVYLEQVAAGESDE